MTTVALDDLEPGLAYRFKYQGAGGPLWFEQKGVYLRSDVSMGVLWFWFRVRDSKGGTFELPYGYTDLADVEIEAIGWDQL